MTSTFSPYSHHPTTDQMVDNAVRHWEARRQAARQQGPALKSGRALTIALSREVGTLGTAAAQEVGRRLGWQVYDHELLERIAQEMGVRAALLESVDERQQGWLTESISALLTPHFGGKPSAVVCETVYVRRLIETILALGIHGECVIVGRGAAFILPRETTLRVRLVAPPKVRIAVLSRKLEISAKDAARQIRTTDRERHKFVKDHFFRDPAAPQNYDLVLNTARASTGAIATLIVAALHELQTIAQTQGEIARPLSRGCQP
jgi:cytidylate kinase